MNYQPITVNVNDTSPMKNPVEGVTINVYSQDGTQFITQTQTNTTGQAGLSLPDGTTYQLRFFKFGVGFTNPQYIEVLPAPGTNSFSIPANVLTPPVSNDARLCMAYGFMRDIVGAPAKFVDIQIIAKFKPLILDDAALLTERQSFQSDERGYVKIPLIRHGHYDVTIAGFEDYLRHIEVPDAPSVNFADLLFPVVEAITFSPAIPPTMVGGSGDLQVTPMGLRSDGNEIKPRNLSRDVQWCSSNPQVLAVILSGDMLTLRPLTAGTAEVQAKRWDKTIVRIPNTPIAGVPVTVVVT